MRIQTVQLLYVFGKRWIDLRQQNIYRSISAFHAIVLFLLWCTTRYNCLHLNLNRNICLSVQAIESMFIAILVRFYFSLFLFVKASRGIPEQEAGNNLFIKTLLPIVIKTGCL